MGSRMRSPRTGAAGFLSLAVVIVALAAAKPIAADEVRFAFNERVTLLVPTATRLFSDRTISKRGERFQVMELSEGAEGRVIIGGDSQWRLAGFPSLRVCRGYKPKASSKMPGFVKMDLFCDKGNVMLVVEGRDIEKAKSLFRQVLARGNADSPAARQQVRDAAEAISAHVFDGSLASFPEAARIPFVLLLVTEGAVAIDRLFYKNAEYFQIDFGVHGEVYNTIQMGRSDRVRRVINELFLEALSTDAAQLRAATGLGGIGLVTEIRYRNFVTNNESGADVLEIFAPMEPLLRFIADEITAQQLLDGSVVRLDGSRIEVSLH